MMFRESFDFNPGTLGYNLATIDDKIHDFIERDLAVCAVKGEATMKTEHPWKNRTGDAEIGLWAESHKIGERYQLNMGHGVEYGIYLEKSNGGRFQIVMPTLVETARVFMESLEQMFAQLEVHAPPVVPAIAPGIGREGTSQGAIEHGQEARGAIEKVVGRARKVKVYFRDKQGRFISTKTTAKTKRTKRG